MSSPGDAHMPRAPAMPACLAPWRCPHASRPGDARMPRAPAMPACLAPRRCPHASRPGDARMPRAPAMPACLAPRRCPHASRPGDARMPRAPAMPACLAPRRCPHASRPGDARMPRAPAMPDDTSPRLPEGSSFHYVTSKLKYHDTGREKDCLPQVGQWNMTNKKMVNRGTINNWFCINFSRSVQDSVARGFCYELAQMCCISGMDPEFDVFVLLDMLDALDLFPLVSSHFLCLV
ncbi:hypothetical protein VNO80_19308 [Phaseolus coccineus]|uniref:Uncharacterized protein n=1 Tax=Phaseolus coccineus TaxID=3886 RepID=A0AAN9QX75_PHACN